MNVRSFLTLLGPITLFAAATTGTPAWADMNASQIKAVADRFMAQHSRDLAQQYGQATRIEYRIDPLDSRLSMADCPVPVTAAIKSPVSIGHINIQVRCDSPIQWTLYVPAEVQLFRPVVIPIGPLGRGTTISASDLQLREIDISQLNGSYFTDIEEVVGMEARRLLPADRPIIASQLKAPVMINKGDAVIVTANSGGLKVKMPGVALADGYEGQQISVRNSTSERVVDALVTAPGQVEVPM